METKVKELHAEMVLKISGRMHPDLKAEWDKFENMMEIYLEPVDIENMKTFKKATNLLLRNKKIAIGDYGVLTTIFNKIDHQIICGIIADYTNKIQVQRMSESQQEYDQMKTADEDKPNIN